MKSIRAGLILFGEEDQNNIFPAREGLDSGSRGFPGSHLISGAVRAFWAAEALGIRLSTQDGFIDWEATREPPASLTCLIRDHKPGLIEILKGDRCRWCGELLDWPRPVGVVFGDQTAECLPCGDAEAHLARRRAVR